MDRRRFLQGVVLAGAAAGGAMPWRMAHATSVDAAGEPRMLGQASAPITINEHSSLTCPHCKRFHVETLPTLKKEYIDTGLVKLVYFDFPFDQAGLRAAMLARCAPPQRYFQFLDVLFQQQANWANQDFMNNLKAIGSVGGISAAKFDACMADEGLVDAVVAQRFEAERELGVNSTPTFFISGGAESGTTTVRGAQPFEEFKKILDSRLNA